MGKELKKALLIFAKQPIPGEVKTRLVPPLSPEQAAELYGCMLEDILAKTAHFIDVERYLYYDGGEGAAGYFSAKAAGITCIPQRGKDLGERMAEAFREAFAMGHGPALIIGTDSPDLPPSYIEEAFCRLESGDSDAVFGPTKDGGYYLVGMASLHRQLFRDIPWSSDMVLRDTLERAGHAGIRVSLLPPWHDVDTAADLRRPELLDEFNGAPLTRKFLLGLLEGRS